MVPRRRGIALAAVRTTVGSRAIQAGSVLAVIEDVLNAQVELEAGNRVIAGWLDQLELAAVIDAVPPPARLASDQANALGSSPCASLKRLPPRCSRARPTSYRDDDEEVPRVPDSKARQKCLARQYSGHDALPADCKSPWQTTMGR
jgi:hypothetical protein